MKSQFLLLPLLLHFIIQATAQEHSDATIAVKGSALVAETSDSFVCATLDWWPREKCNYDQCPWGESSVLNLVSSLVWCLLGSDKLLLCGFREKKNCNDCFGSMVVPQDLIHPFLAKSIGGNPLLFF